VEKDLRKLTESFRKQKKLRKPEDLFVGQQGKFIELLVEGNLVRLLREKKY
jgi:hypothetical protein